MRRADHSSRGVLLTVVRRCVWSRNRVNEEDLAHWRAVAPKTNLFINIWLRPNILTLDLLPSCTWMFATISVPIKKELQKVLCCYYCETWSPVIFLFFIQKFKNFNSNVSLGKSQNSHGTRYRENGDCGFLQCGSSAKSSALRGRRDKAHDQSGGSSCSPCSECHEPIRYGMAV